MRKLVIVDHGDHWAAANGEGVNEVAKTLERLIEKLANRYSISFDDVTNAHGAVEVLDTLMGQRREGDSGNIHTGIESG